MSRKRKAPKKLPVIDPKYKSTIIPKLINSIMYDGKKTVAEKIIYDAIDKIKSKSKDVSTIDFWKEYVSEVARTLTNKDETEARYREVLHEEIKSPVTAKIFMQLGQASQELLAKSLASDLKIRDQKECEEAARLIAITLWGAHADMMRRYDNDRNLNLQAEVIATIERVESFCRPLFKSYR